MIDLECICDTCEWYASEYDVCCNGDSEWCADFRLKNDSCEEWEAVKMGNVRYPRLRKKSSLESRKEMSKRTAKAAMDIYLTLSIAILADVFSFGEKRIKRFTDAYMALADSLGTGTDDIETIQKNIREQFNVDI